MKSSGNIDTETYPASLGLTLELCAGIIDHPDLSLKEHMKREVLEETGYKVGDEDIVPIKTYR